MKSDLTSRTTESKTRAENLYRRVEGLFLEQLYEILENDVKHSDIGKIGTAAFREKIRTAFLGAMDYAGVLPEIVSICVHCKKIKNHEGAWIRLESFLYEHSNLEFSHGYCEQCAEEISIKYKLNDEACPK